VPNLGSVIKLRTMSLVLTGGLTGMSETDLARRGSATVAAGITEAAEPVLEQVVGPLEIGTEPPDGGGAMLAGERLLACGVEYLAVDADEQTGRDPCIALVDAELALDRARQHLREAGHHLELLGPQCGRLLDDPREVGEARAAETRALTYLQAAERREDRLSGLAFSDRGDEQRLALRNFVEEEVFLRRKVVEDRLLRDTRGGRHLGDGDALEATRHEEAHRLVGDLLPRLELLRLPQAHALSVTRKLQLQKSFSVCKFP
jgi:hypothetical protein